MIEREAEIRGLCGVGKLDVLADDLVASDMAIPEVRHLLLSTLAWLDMATSGVVPPLDDLDDVPPAVAAKVRALIGNVIAELPGPGKGIPS